MERDPQTHDSHVVAAMLSAQGRVSALRTDEALEQLTLACHVSNEEDAPYGLVVHPALTPSGTIRVGGTWHRYLNAFKCVEAALSDQPPDVLKSADALNHLQLGTDIFIVAACHHGRHWRPAVDEKMASARAAGSQALNRDVYLLLTHRLAEELKTAEHFAMPKDMRLIVRVRSRSTRGRRYSKHVFLDSRVALDGKTLSWRQAFIQNIRCLTAQEVAKEGGHDAKNTSATASRWISDRKIFSVTYGGRRLYPDFQFRHGQPRPVIARVLEALPADPTGWDYAYFFATANSYMEQKRPMDELDSDPEKIVRLAQRFAQPADVF
jgi:hypothetical protein